MPTIARSSSTRAKDWRSSSMGKLQSAQLLLRDQQRQQASAGIHAPAAAELAKQHVHGIGHIRRRAVLAVLLQPDGKDRQRIPLLPGSQNARADQRGQQRGIVLLRLLGKAVEQQRQQSSRQPLFSGFCGSRRANFRRIFPRISASASVSSRMLMGLSR